jgi:hypothetical protein
VATKFQSNAHIGKKLSNIFKRFYTIFKRFYTVFEYFQTFSNVFKRFLHELARLMRKSALLIEILTLLRINLRVWFEIVVLFPPLFWEIRYQNIHFCVNSPQPTAPFSPANFICPIRLNLSPQPVQQYPLQFM